MKTMKKLFAVLLAVVMTLGMMTTVFAAQTGDLTINGTTAGKSYDLYKVMDLTQDGAAYSYTVNSNFAGFFTAKGWDDPVAEIGKLTGNATSEFAKELLAWADTNNVAYTTRVTGTDTATVVTGLEYGYYLLNPVGALEASGNYATMFSLNTLSGNEATITVKAVYPTIEKKVGDDAKVSETSIGKEVPYTLTSKVPDMTGYNAYYYIITDTMTKGLTYQQIDSIKIGETVLYDVEDATKVLADVATVTTSAAANDGTALKIVFKNFIGYAAQAGQVVEIKYTAILNEKAVINGANVNEVKLDYSNDPTYDYDGDKDEPDPEDPMGTTVPDTTETYTTKLNLKKVDGNMNPLKGASFKIEGDGVKTVIITKHTFEEAADGTYWKLKNGTYTTTDPAAEGINQDAYESTTVKYKVVEAPEVVETSATVNAEAAVSEDGTLSFSGLGAGVYTITETVVPDGYNSIDPIKVKVTFDATNKTYSYEVTEGTGTLNGDTLTVVNQSGLVLPSTGGIGTTIMYVIGAILVIGAGVVLITRRRMINE